jgi:FkbM family methyltransferase
MTARRVLTQALDRNGGRWLLGRLATWYARRMTGRDIKTWHDDLWIRSLGSEVFVADKPTFEYYANDFTDFPELVRRIFEDATDFWFHVYKPQNGDVIVDIGAGVGFDTIAFSRAVGPAGTVISIESHPTTFRRLKKVCELNQLTNTICLQVAVVDREREVYMNDLPDDLFNSATLEPSPNGVFKVEGNSLDSICKQQDVERIDFLKMNIEGAERVAIDGMSEVIGKTRFVCIACHDFLADQSETFRTRETILDFLKRHDFQVIQRREDERRAVRDHLHAVNRQLEPRWTKPEVNENL